MKRITEINDARLVKGLAHPMRIHILQVLERRVASPSEIAEEIGAPLGNVSYHVRFLVRVGLIELASTTPRRGAVEHYYRTVGRARITDKAWAKVPKIVKDSLIGLALAQAERLIAAAASAGGFDRTNVHVSRRVLRVDDQGFSDLSTAIKELVDRAYEIESASAKRLTAGNHVAAELDAGLVMLLFEAMESQHDLAGKRKLGQSPTARP